MSQELQLLRNADEAANLLDMLHLGEGLRLPVIASALGRSRAEAIFEVWIGAEGDRWQPNASADTAEA